MSTEHSLEDAVSIVTGAGGQIGEGIAVELAKAGSDVVVADVDVLDTEYNQQSSTEVGGATRAEEVAGRVEEHGRRAHIVECDVTHADQVEAMVEETISEFGRLDVLCNNAGIITFDTVDEMDEAEWDSVMDVNVKGVFLPSRAAIPHLKESKGSIINTASIAGTIGAAGLAHYCASKHAVLGLTKSLSLELAGDDVTVNAICPGIVDTPMWSKVLTPQMGEDYEETVKRAIPLGRDQSPEDMGRLAVFYATNRNVTGQALAVDGGILQNVI
ncbi:SDR family NAD(P)-dependent oxidoreductase [Halogeometricum sp. CBA1124]|jgi:meso-butanediol dehydrogenase/(S,S)-butanediol dehydrogenase/diacetyl reductase|uniref:SDR family NAD(P)-dependent oxidoreductase n=1 Tax=Halogeometricum sp. CBA1124 TaxID=2668071 RepID=UPI00142B6B66|nr:SDR family NAD(P)-dependent oxidoreductase [Halogeometricum sp. CBA1124]MUV56442.1 glucose 1-dehydrogenase [Halogeometricum sp. CBA1124]